MGDGDFLLIRHGESIWNARGLWQGQGDPPLSPRGRAQARRLAISLAGEGLVALVSSDLRRAAQTARIAARALGMAPELEARLRELDVGAWSGLAEAEVARRWPEELARFRAGELDLRVGGGETRRELRTRAGQALASLAARFPAGRVAVVTHGGVVRALLGEGELANGEWRRAPRALLV